MASISAAYTSAGFGFFGPAVAAPAHVYLGQLYLNRGEPEPALSEYLAAAYVYPDTSWAARGLQGAIQTYLARQMPREALALLKKLQGRPGLAPALAKFTKCVPRPGANGLPRR